MRNMLICLFAILFLACCAPNVLAEQYSGIAWSFELYGGELSDEALEWISDSYEPETIVFGDISVMFTEVLCDGRWLYASVEVKPNDPDAVLIIPCSAFLDDLVSGGYGEGLRDDGRTFIDAAAQDGKRLVMVYIYPDLLNTLPEYFTDHFQLADDISILLSGGMVSLERETLITDWYMYAFDIDPQTGERIDETILEARHRLEAPVLLPTERHEYKVADTAAGDIPFTTMTLIWTPLTTYTEIDWIDEENYYIYDFMLADADGAWYPQGASAEVNVFAMDKLPDTLMMGMINRSNEEEAFTIMLEAVGES